MLERYSFALASNTNHTRRRTTFKPFHPKGDQRDSSRASSSAEKGASNESKQTWLRGIQKKNQKQKPSGKRVIINSSKTNTTTRITKSRASCLAALVSFALLLVCGGTQTHRVQAAKRMVRLCIASVDPVKLSSQCVMCNRNELPLTVIDCTGITQVHALIANPLSVQEAKCLIYNCRRVSSPNVWAALSIAQQSVSHVCTPVWWRCSPSSHIIRLLGVTIDWRRVA